MAASAPAAAAVAAAALAAATATTAAAVGAGALPSVTAPPAGQAVAPAALQTSPPSVSAEAAGGGSGQGRGGAKLEASLLASLQEKIKARAAAPEKLKTTGVAFQAVEEVGGVFCGVVWCVLFSFVALAVVILWYRSCSLLGVFLSLPRSSHDKLSLCSLFCS